MHASRELAAANYQAPLKPGSETPVSTATVNMHARSSRVLRACLLSEEYTWHSSLTLCFSHDMQLPPARQQRLAWQAPQQQQQGR